MDKEVAGGERVVPTVPVGLLAPVRGRTVGAERPYIPTCKTQQPGSEWLRGYDFCQPRLYKGRLPVLLLLLWVPHTQVGWPWRLHLRESSISSYNVSTEFITAQSQLEYQNSARKRGRQGIMLRQYQRLKRGLGPTSNNTIWRNFIPIVHW